MQRHGAIFHNKVITTTVEPEAIGQLVADRPRVGRFGADFQTGPTGDASSYQVGDRVIVFGELSMGMMAVLWAFIIPFCILVISLFVFMAIWSDELLSALCSLALLIPYYYILWLNKTRMGKKFSFSIRPID